MVRIVVLFSAFIMALSQNNWALAAGRVGGAVSTGGKGISGRMSTGGVSAFKMPSSLKAPGSGVSLTRSTLASGTSGLKFNSIDKSYMGTRFSARDIVSGGRGVRNGYDVHPSQDLFLNYPVYYFLLFNPDDGDDAEAVDISNFALRANVSKESFIYDFSTRQELEDFVTKNSQKGITPAQPAADWASLTGDYKLQGQFSMASGFVYEKYSHTVLYGQYTHTDYVLFYNDPDKQGTVSTKTFCGYLSPLNSEANELYAMGDFIKWNGLLTIPENTTTNTLPEED